MKQNLLMQRLIFEPLFFFKKLFLGDENGTPLLRNLYLMVPIVRVTMRTQHPECSNNHSFTTYDVKICVELCSFL